jgi:hypothetical protein
MFRIRSLCAVLTASALVSCSELSDRTSGARVDTTSLPSSRDAVADIPQIAAAARTDSTRLLPGDTVLLLELTSGAVQELRAPEGERYALVGRLGAETDGTGAYVIRSTATSDDGYSGVLILDARSGRQIGRYDGIPALSPDAARVLVLQPYYDEANYDASMVLLFVARVEADTLVQELSEGFEVDEGGEVALAEAWWRDALNIEVWQRGGVVMARRVRRGDGWTFP